MPENTPVGIQSLAHFEAPVVVTRADTAYLFELIPPEFRATFNSPSSFRRFAADPLASEKAAVTVALEALSRASLAASDIDAVVATSFVAHWQQWYPAFGSYVHRELALGADVRVLNIQSQCASFVDALRLSWQLCKGGRYRRILVVAATEGLKEGDPTDPVAAWAGDGAASAIISSEALQAEFIGYDFFAVGELHRDYRMRLRDRAFPAVAPPGAIGEERGFWAVRDLAALLKWMGADFAKMLGDGMQRALDSAAIKPDQLGSVFYHQMGPRNQIVLLHAGEAIGIPDEVFRDTFDSFGCAGNVDGAISLSILRERGELPEGTISLLHASGVGGANPALLMRWCQ
ncbi:3-oxoacyl-[acyl-carrier-protein] synthase III C-terminal domain-containing protein [Aquisediminimonas profunda]|uniref:3-oxoacyl-[acyl-carrier-protein] synthase III C-terminal domain-containing protein n=1 Tax=Aquisediminimonas profunda TaxID=1550733 RepID=UPI001C635879|nr:3-oxoacyl-[acyl-carrier-protein] synthase III C-terminal domain-containing protein [Aquisediminimonas profunda]